MSKLKTIFFGTHNFAAEILQGMIDSGLFDIQLVITQPDKPAGRKQELKKPAVKVLAEKYKIKIEQPQTLRNYELKIMNYELGVCAQYGLMIPKHILDAPKFGIINVHASLLPKYRGASPIQTALVNGETKTGVTIMKMDAGLDTGPILAQKSLKIAPEDTFTTLSQKLAKIANSALTEAIPKYISGELIPTPQDSSKVTFCKELTREDGRIDWNKTAQEIYNQYRGLTPWPGVWTTFNGKRLKLLKIRPSKFQISNFKFQIENDKIYIGCGEDSIEIEKLQLEGGKSVSAKEFVNGYRKINKIILV